MVCVQLHLDCGQEHQRLRTASQVVQLYSPSCLTTYAKHGRYCGRWRISCGNASSLRAPNGLHINALSAAEQTKQLGHTGDAQSRRSRPSYGWR